jgi:ribosome-associated protein
MDSKELSLLIAKLIQNKKGENIKILNLTNLTPVADFFVICTASSEPQVKAISDYISEETKKKGEKPWHSEGYQNLSWVLLDYVDVVVHIFLRESRSFYNLEGLWADAAITEIKE